MFCTGCGTRSADSDAICGGCGTPRRQASANDARPAKAVFHLGQAMQQQAPPASINSWRWGAGALTVLALLALWAVIAVT